MTSDGIVLWVDVAEEWRSHLCARSGTGEGDGKKREVCESVAVMRSGKGGVGDRRRGADFCENKGEENRLVALELGEGLGGTAALEVIATFGAGADMTTEVPFGRLLGAGVSRTSLDFWTGCVEEGEAFEDAAPVVWLGLPVV